MGSIAVVGLGPGAREHLTRQAETILTAAAAERRLLLRTRIHPTVAAWDVLSDAPSLDAHYDAGTSFDEVYARIATAVVDAAASLPAATELVYAVPGHPSVGEATVERVRAEAQARGVGVRLVPGLSFVDAVAAVAGIDAGAGLRIADALALGRIDPTVPLLVCQIHSRRVASHVKLTLANHYPDDHEAALIHAAGVPGQERVERLRLHEIDRRPTIAHLTSLWVPALQPLDAVREPQTLREIMARLRAPEPEGCPWDREQTHESLRRYLLEETYEALDALDAGDIAALEEELGDLLLQIVFHAQIAGEAGHFDLGDVVAGISRKLIRRHPHVFGAVEAGDAGAVLRSWEALKREERDEKAQSERSMLDGVPRSMPALSQAQAIQDRAARVGFDWPNVEGVLEKLVEEVRELAQAPSLETRRDELGDVLFVLVRLATWLDVDAEDTLRQATRKFRARFAEMERAARRAGKTRDEYDASDLDRLWRRAKESV